MSFPHSVRHSCVYRPWDKFLYSLFKEVLVLCYQPSWHNCFQFAIVLALTASRFYISAGNRWQLIGNEFPDVITYIVGPLSWNFVKCRVISWPTFVFPKRKSSSFFFTHQTAKRTYEMWKRPSLVSWYDVKSDTTFTDLSLSLVEYKVTSLAMRKDF